MSTDAKAAADLRRDWEEKEKVLLGKQHQLKALYDATKSEDGPRIVQPHQAEQIRILEGACASMIDQVNALKLDWAAARNEEDLERRTREPAERPPIHPVTPGGGAHVPGEAAAAAAVKARTPASLGEAFLTSASYRNWVHGGQSQTAHLEVPTLGIREYAWKSASKATLLTSTGPFTAIQKEPGVITLGTEMFTVADLLTQAQTTSSTIRYIKEDTLTNAAAGVAEEGLKPEATFDLSEVDVTVKKVAVIGRMSDEMFQDQGQVITYVEDRLPWMVRQEEEEMLLTGDGLGNNLLGILNVPGILTQAKGTYNNIDAVYLALTKVRTQGFFEPDAIVIHPNNWSVIRLAKTTDGLYHYGHPAIPGPETLFGKRVVVTANMTANTAVVGAWRMGATLFIRQGMRIEATNSDGEDFRYNRVAMRVEIREAPAWWRPKAFCSISGLDAPV